MGISKAMTWPMSRDYEKDKGRITHTYIHITVVIDSYQRNTLLHYTKTWPVSCDCERDEGRKMRDIFTSQPVFTMSYYQKKKKD